MPLVSQRSLSATSRITSAKPSVTIAEIIVAQPQRREGDDKPDDRADGQRGAPANQTPARRPRSAIADA